MGGCYGGRARGQRGGGAHPIFEAGQAFRRLEKARHLISLSILGRLKQLVVRHRRVSRAGWVLRGARGRKGGTRGARGGRRSAMAAASGRATVLRRVGRSRGVCHRGHAEMWVFGGVQAAGGGEVCGQCVAREARRHQLVRRPLRRSVGLGSARTGGAARRGRAGRQRARCRGGVGVSWVPRVSDAAGTHRARVLSA